MQFYTVNAQSNEYAKNFKNWQNERIEELKSEKGYLNLAGLFWLKEGESTIGKAKSNSIQFKTENTSDFLGKVTVQNGEVWFDPMDNKEIYINDKPAIKSKIFPDGGNPIILRHNDLRWFIIQRGADLGIRLRDYNGEFLKNFKGIANYPLDQNMVVEGTFIPTPGRKLNITLATGQPYVSESPGKVVFTLNGVEHSLEATGSLKNLFFVFGDETNNEETYGGGRFLEAKGPDANNKVVLDFNRAYNPPCAFTPYATCPLPTKENKLPRPILAGEKYSDTH